MVSWLRTRNPENIFRKLNENWKHNNSKNIFWMQQIKSLQFIRCTAELQIESIQKFCWERESDFKSLSDNEGESISFNFPLSVDFCPNTETVLILERKQKRKRYTKSLSKYPTEEKNKILHRFTRSSKQAEVKKHEKNALRKNETKKIVQRRTRRKKHCEMQRRGKKNISRKDGKCS